MCGRKEAPPPARQGRGALISLTPRAGKSVNNANHNSAREGIGSGRRRLWRCWLWVAATSCATATAAASGATALTAVAALPTDGASISASHAWIFLHPVHERAQRRRVCREVVGVHPRCAYLRSVAGERPRQEWWQSLGARALSRGKQELHGWAGVPRRRRRALRVRPYGSRLH